MRMYDVILKKRQGIELSDKEIQWLIRGYVGGNIPDYQMSAFLMADTRIEFHLLKKNTYLQQF